MLHRTHHALEITHRALAHIEVETLAKRHVKTAYATADWGHERAFYSHEILAESVHGGLWQPLARQLMGLASGEHFLPFYLALTSVSLLHGRVDHGLHHRSDLRAHAVALDERNGRGVRHHQFTIYLCYLHDCLCFYFVK